MSFKDRLKEARKKQKKTQREMANLLGIKPSTYSGYETGYSEPNMNILSKIVDILECDPNFLLQDEIKRNMIINKQYNLSIKEKEHLNNYRRLNDERKKRIDKIINMELEEQDEMDFINSSRTFSGSTS